MVLLLLFAGCREKLVQNCDTRIPFYPDADGNGLGERTDVYLGCTPPAGWVAVLEPDTGTTPAIPTTTSTGSTGDTGG